MKTDKHSETLIERLKKRYIEAMKKLQDLGARLLTSENGTKMLYIPGNVNIGAPTPVDLYGAHVAMRGRSHKSFLRKHNLGKFKKGK